PKCRLARGPNSHAGPRVLAPVGFLSITANPAATSPGLVMRSYPHLCDLHRSERIESPAQLLPIVEVGPEDGSTVGTGAKLDGTGENAMNDRGQRHTRKQEKQAPRFAMTGGRVFSHPKFRPKMPAISSTVVAFPARNSRPRVSAF